MTGQDWIFFGVALASLLFAVWSLRVAASYRFQVENVQMAASIARDRNVALRHVNQSLTMVIRAYEGQLREKTRHIEVVEGMNRMLISAQPKPRAPRKAPQNPVTTGKSTSRKK
jgi:hypothetical protein